jgi:hypothetical protein
MIQYDNISESRYRKLCALGIAALVSTGRPEILDRLPTEIFNMWIDVFAELKEAQRLKEEDGCASPACHTCRTIAHTVKSETQVTFYWDQPASSYFKQSEHTPEYARRKAVSVFKDKPDFCDH